MGDSGGSGYIQLVPENERRARRGSSSWDETRPLVRLRNAQFAFGIQVETLSGGKKEKINPHLVPLRRESQGDEEKGGGPALGMRVQGTVARIFEGKSIRG